MIEILGHIADTGRYSGGATAAALSAALATSTTRLVVNVDRNRKALAGQLPAMDQLAADLEQLEQRFIQLASDDAKALARLMNAYQDRKNDPERHLELLCAAADSTIEIASAILQLLELTALEIERANRFIVSDLAAAASMARGALGAVEPTCEINLQLIEEIEGGEGEAAQRRRSRYSSIRESALDLTQTIIEASNSRVMKRSGGGTK